MIGYVVGDSDMVTGFKLAGIEGSEVSSKEEARQSLKKALAKKDVGIIIMSQEYSNDPEIRQQIDKIRQDQTTPLIVEIPGSRGQSTYVPISNTISKILGIKI